MSASGSRSGAGSDIGESGSLVVGIRIMHGILEWSVTTALYRGDCSTQ